MPRSGSTLLQRLLAAHEKIETATEPWLLFPFFYGFKPDGAAAEYGHRLFCQALSDFVDQLPEGRESYLAALRRFSLDLYGQAAGSKAAYFVDKTPRYSLIVDDVIEAFPEAKVIFLWRNPLAVAASIVRTFGHGHFNLVRFRLELFTGMDHLIEASRRHKDRALAVRYEDITSDPQATLPAIFRYLDLEYDPSIRVGFADVRPDGVHGDHVGVDQYATLSKEPLGKWRGFYCNPIRRHWAMSYLDWLGRERMSEMGYDHDALVDELKGLPGGFAHVAADALTMGKQSLIAALQLRLILKRLHAHRTGEPFVSFE